MDDNAHRCEAINTSNNARCKRSGKHLSEGRLYCSMHKPTGECAICLDNIKHRGSKTLSCGHVFHTKCLKLMIRKTITSEISCPLCRTPINKDIIKELASIPTSVGLPPMDHEDAIAQLRVLFTTDLTNEEFHDLHNLLVGNILYTITVL